MLVDSAYNVHSQHGDDGMIEAVMRRYGTDRGFCVEFGANDGTSCSNTLLLREKGWSALLVEGDPDLYRALFRGHRKNGVECVNMMLTPTGETSIDHLLGGRHVDFMSVDIDGDDYGIVAELQTRPDLLVVEYNPSVPWFLDIRAIGLVNTFGASALAFHRLLAAKQFTLIGANYANLYYVPQEKEHLFDDWMSGYGDICGSLPLRCGFIASDYAGNPLILDTDRLPWGLSAHIVCGGGAGLQGKEFEQELIFGEPFSYGRSLIQGINRDGTDMWCNY